MLLNVTNLLSGYGNVRIVNDVSFSAAPNEIVAIIGRNGVGKTTLMKSLVGLISCAGGKIEFKSTDVTRMSAAKRARLGIGYVPQGRGIFTRLSVGDNLRMGEKVGNSSSSKNFDRVFEFFPILKERQNQKAGSLSGGEQQQLSIGRILVGSPELILLDEPSEGVQPNIVQEIGRIIRRLRDDEGLTVVIVEQNLDLIYAVADRCIVMDKGTIVAELTANELREPDVARRYLAI
ncbi:MAG: ABC transporter ATP-binding protein [Alphaproteobacteria bacterium]|jgi:urea ABC transporter ATP-binding protein UrtE|nr:ABC transporter ATP-binding protein [Alphaproteobacteria bacterium]